MKIAFGAAALMFGLCLLAPPAMAGSVECIWQKLPQAPRDAYLAQSDGSDVSDVVKVIGEDIIFDAVESCGVKDDDMTAAGGAFAGIVRQKVAEARLAKSMGLTPEQLDTAWKTVDQAAAVDLAKAISSQDDDLGRSALGRILPALTAALPASKAPSADLAVYAMGRSTRGYFESQF